MQAGHAIPGVVYLGRDWLLYADPDLRFNLSENVAPALVFGHNGFLWPCQGIRPPGDTWLHLYAVDLARAPDGRWWVVADRTQAPSGPGYAMATRRIISRVMAGLHRSTPLARLRGFFQTFSASLQDASPTATEPPRVVLLTPGPGSETAFEQAYLATLLGFPLVEGQDLTVRDEKVWLRTLDGLQRVHVILRRVDDIWCDPLELREDSALGVAGLVAAVRAGKVTVANALGSGILETGALLGYLPRLAEHLLGQKLKMPSVATWWCGQPREQSIVIDNLDAMSVAPAFRSAGGGLSGEIATFALFLFRL